jgi:serine/threonine protein kinase
LPVSLDALIESRAAAEPRRPFSAARCGAIVRDIADGLAYLHGLEPPLLPRDLKPANCFFDAAATEVRRAR